MTMFGGAGSAPEATTYDSKVVKAASTACLAVLGLGFLEADEEQSMAANSRMMDERA